MQIVSKRMVALLLSGAAAFACSQAGEDVTRSAAPLAGETREGGEQGAARADRTGERASERESVLADVQRAIERYRESKSEVEAEALDARFAGTVLYFDRERASLEPREERALTEGELAQALEMAATRSPASLEADLKRALGDLVWHAATHAPTGADEQALTLLTTARSFSDAFPEAADGGLGVDGGAGTTTTTDAGADASADAGRRDPAPLDLCTLCPPKPKPSLQEELFCKGLKLLARQAARHSEEQGEDLLLCPSDECKPLGGGIGREGFRGKVKWKDLLDGELSGRATYGFECGGGIMEVSVFGSGIFGGDPEYGASVSWGIRF